MRLGCRTVKVVEERTVGRVSRYFVHIFTFLLVRFIVSVNSLPAVTVTNLSPASRGRPSSRALEPRLL